jgi:hypothetical protein
MKKRGPFAGPRRREITDALNLFEVLFAERRPPQLTDEVNGTGLFDEQ